MVCSAAVEPTPQPASWDDVELLASLWTCRFYLFKVVSDVLRCFDFLENYVLPNIWRFCFSLTMSLWGLYRNYLLSSVWKNSTWPEHSQDLNPIWDEAPLGWNGTLTSSQTPITQCQCLTSCVWMGANPHSPVLTSNGKSSLKSGSCYSSKRKNQYLNNAHDLEIKCLTEHIENATVFGCLYCILGHLAYIYDIRSSCF